MTETDPVPVEEAAEPQLVDLVADEQALARAQLVAGQPGLAEGTVRRRLAWLEAEGVAAPDELDALRVLLAESLWRQGRLSSARAVLDAIRPSSPQRRLPVVLVIEAEALAAAGERDRAAGTMERALDAIGIDAAFEVRAGVPGRLSWPLPADLRPPPPPEARPPWSSGAPEGEAEPAIPEDERVAAGRSRMEEARVAYVAGDLGRGDAEMSIAVRLDPSLAGDGVAILEPTLGAQPGTERLLLYGDLLRAAGRETEANDAYDRAAGQRG
jgi:tetratricopeptide (TPR) repeat protein